MKIQSVIFLSENLANTNKFHDTWVFSFSGFSCITEILQSPDSDEEVSRKKKTLKIDTVLALAWLKHGNLNTLTEENS